MSFKKIIAMLLCILSLSTMLVGCKEENETDRWLKYYKDENKGQPVEVPNVDIDFYIIKGENEKMTDSITKPVQDKLNQYFYETYHTKVNIKYIAEADYAAQIDSFTADSSGIVLINSEATMDSLSGKLIDLNPYLTSDAYMSKGYGKLNTQISTALLDAATVIENGTEKLYCVPNNHIIGNYEYLVINKTKAAELLYANSELSEMTSAELASELIEAAGETFPLTPVEYKKDIVFTDVVTYVVNAPFEAKKAIEAAGMIVNVAEYPIADKTEVYSSAFAVLKGTPADPADSTKKVEYELYAERAMQVIYEINSNTAIRNLLQYGVENVNYHRENGIVKFSDDKPYEMNLIYTGDIFKAYYSDAWTKEQAENGLAQNKQAK